MTTTTNRAIVDAYPLTATQAGMLFHSEYVPGSATFHDVFTMTVRGRWDPCALDDAVAEAVARHPVLRTSIDVTRFSEPLQLIHREARAPIEVTDLTSRTAAAAADHVRAFCAAESGRRFDWSTPPLLRVHAHLLPGDEFALTFSYHHAILDGWSLVSLATEVVRRYAGRLDGTPLPVVPPRSRYRDHVARVREATAAPETIEFWRAQVTDAPASRLPRLPGYPVSASEEIDVVAVPVAPDLMAKLERVAAQLGVPLPSVLLAGHVRVLALLTGETEVTTGLVTHGRPEEDSGADVLGMFLNAVPLRVPVTAATWTALIHAVHHAELTVLPHRRYPLFEIQRLTGRAPFDTVFEFRDFHMFLEGNRDAPTAAAPRPAVEVVERRVFAQTDVPLAANLVRSPFDRGLSIMLAYQPAQFPAGLVRTAAGFYQRAFQDIAADPGRDPRPTIGYLRGNDNERIAGWNHTAPTATPVGVHRLVATRVAEDPDTKAVWANGEWLTYRQFGDRVNRLAQVLRDHGVGPDVVVGVFVEPGADLPIGVHAALAAGGGFLVLDPKYPDDRLRSMASEAGAAIIVTTEALSPRLTGACDLLALDHPDTTAAVAAAGTAPPDVAVPADALAYVAFTSGSTGRPDAVAVSHRALENSLSRMAATFPMTTADRVLLDTPLSAGGSTRELLWPLTTGSGMVVPRPGGRHEPPYLAGLIADHRVTTLFLPPSTLHALLEQESPQRLDTVRRVISSGEPPPPELVARFAALLPDARLHNVHGPADAAVEVSWHEAGASDRTAPTGPPRAGNRLEVLDANLHRLPVGVAGELYVGGTQLPRGYLNRPGLTAGRFLPDPYGPPGSRMYRTGDLARWRPDGQLDFPGRLDHQRELDPRAVPPPASITVDTGYVAPRDQLETQLARAWEQILGLDRVGIDDDFFALGGHSLLALRLTVRIRQDLGRDLSVATVMTAPTIRSLATQLVALADLARPNPRP